MTDPVAELLKRYSKVLADYDSCPAEPTETLAAHRQAHDEILDEVKAADFHATTLQGAVTALRAALAEEEQFNGGTLTIKMLQMAVGYFDDRQAYNSDLPRLISEYHEAQRIWQALDDKDDTKSAPSPEWDAYEAAEDAVLYYPCKTLEDVRTIAAFALSDASAFDSLKNCFRLDGGTPSLVLFLRSLSDHAMAVDIGEN